MGDIIYLFLYKNMEQKNIVFIILLRKVILLTLKNHLKKVNSAKKEQTIVFIASIVNKSFV